MECVTAYYVTPCRTFENDINVFCSTSLHIWKEKSKSHITGETRRRIMIIETDTFKFQIGKCIIMNSSFKLFICTRMGHFRPNKENTRIMTYISLIFLQKLLVQIYTCSTVLCAWNFFCSCFRQVCKIDVRHCDDFGYGPILFQSNEFLVVWEKFEFRMVQVGWIIKLQFMNDHYPDNLLAGRSIFMKQDYLPPQKIVAMTFSCRWDAFCLFDVGSPFLIHRFDCYLSCTYSGKSRTPP